MPLSSSDISDLARQVAKAPGYTSDADRCLNAILSDLCETYDLAVARGVFNFNFNPANVSTFGSGPYPMPLDYLRTSGSSGSDGAGYSAFWTLLGVPYPMIPCDLADFDLQVQQAGLNSYPWLWATDMSQRVIVLNTSGTLVPGTPPTPPVGGFLPAAGGGFIPSAGGGFIPSAGPGAPGNPGVPGQITDLASTDCLTVGMFVSGPGLPPLAQITAIAGTTIDVFPGPLPIQGYLPAAGGGFIPAAGGGFIPSAGPGTQPNTPLMFGFPAVGFAYPPPSGNYPVTVRYQRDMPAIVSPSTSDCVPWFPNSRYLIKQVGAMLMDVTDDSRASGHYAEARGILDHYLFLKDDDSNRAKTVQLDRRIFGSRFSRLKNTKTVGW